MARPKNPVPSYLHHKPSGRAIVRINGKDIPLGRFGSPESRQRYAQILRQIEAGSQQTPSAPPAINEASSSVITVAEVIADYMQHARTYYRKHGEPTSELDNIWQALKLTLELYATHPAAEFGPACLRVVREKMIEKGIVRTSINKRLGRIRRAFEWAVEFERIPSHIGYALKAVKPLLKGRTEARESEPKRPVPSEHIEAVKPHVSRQIRAMIDFQLLTGCRPGSAILLRGCDIDHTDPSVWIYKPERGKTDHHDKDTIVRIGPRAQAVIKPFLDRPSDAYLFSPQEAETERLLNLRANRKTKVQPSQRNRRKASPVRTKGERYSTSSYYHAIVRACKRANREAHKQQPDIPPDQVLVPVWHPHRLRHNAATRLRREFGIETARLILGHSSVVTTEIYAEADFEKAKAAISKFG